MLTRRFLGLLALLGLLLLTAGTLAAFAAANTVPATRADDLSQAVTANALRPAACAALNLTGIVVGSGSFNGTNGNDLILGSAGADTIGARQGTDCILGGSGNDVIQGNQGNDVILAGDGNDQMAGGNGTDVCNGEGGTDTAATCETILNVP
jgi:Ca2+-binding RTX toxin-like protein